jgi:hypothetical protein
MTTITDSLRDTNCLLGPWLDHLASQAGERIVATPENLTAVLSELLRAGAALRAEPLPAQGDDPDLDGELGRYRSHVERLRELLPSIHSHLLAERARLEVQRARIRSATEWARASRQTL